MIDLKPESFNLMTREEMLRRLSAGEDAFDISIDKWERVKSFISGESGEAAKLNMTVDGFRSLIQEACLAKTCALCEVHTEPNWSGMERNKKIQCEGRHYSGTLPCPLSQIYQQCSQDKNNAWESFFDNPTEADAENMIKTIKRARGDYNDKE